MKKNQSLVSGNRLCRDSAATPSSSAPISNRGRVSARVHVLTALTKTWMKTIHGGDRLGTIMDLNPIRHQ